MESVKFIGASVSCCRKRCCGWKIPKQKRARVVPGQLRDRDVRVGNHIAISPGALPRFLARFAEVYGGIGRTEAILSKAAAHHRFLWMHPFLDGNGRVARLMSHAILLDALDTGAIWSVARGLAGRVSEYKSHLSECDLPRRNDLDVRGALSEETLVSFTRFFLEVCIDQVAFMEQLVQPERLRSRILSWVDDEIRLNGLPPKGQAHSRSCALSRPNCRAAMSTRSWARATAKRGASFPPSPIRAYSSLIIRTHRSASCSPPRLQDVGCRDCFPSSRRNLP